MRPSLLPLGPLLAVLLACPTPPVSDDDDDDAGDDDSSGDDDDDSAGGDETLPAGLSELFLTQQVDGAPVSRRILLHAPEEIDPTLDFPVLFAFHGNGGTADMWPGMFNELVNEGAFVGLYPDGHLNSWNLGQEASTADDLAFFEMLLDVLRSYPGVNPDRLFAVGSSNGAGMVQRIAVEGSPLRGIAALSTALTEGHEPTSDTPNLSVMQIHGVADEVCPYDGGPSVTGHVFLSAEDSAAAWAAHNGCSATPAEEELVPGHTRLLWTGCADGHEVEHHRLEGVGHGLPGNFMGEGPARAAWRFFERL